MIVVSVSRVRHRKGWYVYYRTMYKREDGTILVGKIDKFHIYSIFEYIYWKLQIRRIKKFVVVL